MKIAITVTGSVAERVAPSCNAIGSDNADRDSSPILVHSHTSSLQLGHIDSKDVYPTTMAEMKVPAKAKVRILQIFRKKFA